MVGQRLTTRPQQNTPTPRMGDVAGKFLPYHKTGMDGKYTVLVIDDDTALLKMVLSSGAWNDTVRAFLPINTIAQGKALRPKLSGLALGELDYTLRLHTSLVAEIQAAYFFRTDSRTYSDPGLDGASLPPLLGAEVSGGLAWTPVSDISFTLRGGVFFPRGEKLLLRVRPRGGVSLWKPLFSGKQTGPWKSSPPVPRTAILSLK